MHEVDQFGKSRENEILKILSVALRRIFSSEIYDYNKLQEIRLRMNEPLIVIYDNRGIFCERRRESEPQNVRKHIW